MKKEKVMKALKQAMVILTISILVLGVSGCKEKGAAEKAGEKIDQSMEKAADKANELLDK
jgi:outer membrane lipoprotein-sorting protein